MKRTFTLWLLATLCLPVAWAQMANPVRFSVSQKQTAPDELTVTFTGKIDPGWHVYSTRLPAGGPTSATLTTEQKSGAEPKGALMAKGKELNVNDKVFGMQVRYFENSVTFIQKYTLKGGPYTVKGYLEYGACDDEQCLPPTAVEFNYSGKADIADDKKDKEEEDKAADGEEASLLSAVTDSTLTADSVPEALAPRSAQWWQPVGDELQALSGEKNADRTLLYIFLMGFLGGLLALFTPCVWPIIPMTVSFFLKRSKNRRRGLRDAFTYGASIVVIYLVLGVLVTALFGADTLNNLATNAVFNIIFFLILVVFALSFFGWFELRLPSKWADRVDTKATQTTSSLLSIFLMAFTLALVSFSCTAPIVGLLLVEASTSGNWLNPLVGMLGFALALALPFTLFALFPSWLKQAPKSGSWMNMVKVSLGFIELAFALKFLSVADLAYGWGILDREVFLSLWIAIFFLLGLYLIGVLRFQSDGDERRAMPVPCIMLGLLSLAFTIYMVPGLWGAPCKAVSAFAPPITTQDFNLNTRTVHAAYTDYDEGMAAAAQMGKPVLLDFTGHGCVNCRKMEAAVWTDPAVAKCLTEDYVLISLYVDDKRPLPEHIEVSTANGTRTLRTIGDKWSYLSEHKFGQLSQPLYVALDNDGRPLTRAFAYKEDVADYMNFLNEGLQHYREGNTTNTK